MKAKFPCNEARAVADELSNELGMACHRIEIAGSLRRQRPTVGDIEIVYVPKIEERADPDDMFARRLVNIADGVIEQWERAGVLDRRENSLGREMFGPKNKLMLHVATGIPVDLFSATVENWWNYLVCRTGPAELNEEICLSAKARGAKWNPYGLGFTLGNGDVRVMRSEEDVFEFVGLPYEKPEDRS